MTKKSKSTKTTLTTSKILFGTAGGLVVSGYLLQDYALKTSNTILINLSPDIFGAGLLAFVAGLVLFANKKIR